MKRLFLPVRTVNPLWRTQRYVDFRSGLPDPAREARLERMRQLTRRQ